VRKEKQLAGVSPREVERKRQRDEALNAKELAVAAGVSYPIALGWFRLPGFPALGGFVFHSDFVHWRRTRLVAETNLIPEKSQAEQRKHESPEMRPPRRPRDGFSPRAEAMLRLAAGD